jgi:histidinol-phosphatase (PHP family)
LVQLIGREVPFTIGSDAHEPCDAGAGIAAMLSTLMPLGLQRISYYEKRQRIDIDLETLMSR